MNILTIATIASTLFGASQETQTIIGKDGQPKTLVAPDGDPVELQPLGALMTPTMLEIGQVSTAHLDSLQLEPGSSVQWTIERGGWRIIYRLECDEEGGWWISFNAFKEGGE